MKTLDKEKKTVKDLLELMGLDTKGELAARFGKGASAVSNWEKEGVPGSVWKVALDLARETKKADHSPIVEAIIGKVKTLTDAEQGEAYAILSKHFSDVPKRDRP